MRILVTGSRDWPEPGEIYAALDHFYMFREPGRLTIIHGGCPTGADKAADDFARDKRLGLEVYPADWQTHGKAAGPMRNQEMVDTKPGLVLAFPYGESRGTRDCMRRAREAGLKVWEPYVGHFKPKAESDD